MKPAKIVVEDCLGIQSSEEVLIIVDEKSYQIGRELFETVKELGAEPVLVEMVKRKVHGSEPPRLVA